MTAEYAYVKGMDKALGYLASWLPTTDVHVGDVGRFDGPTFVPTSSLEAFGMKFKVKSDTSAGDMQASVGRGIKLTAKAKGQVLDIAPSIPSAKAGVVVNFASSNSSILSASGCVQDQIEDQEELRETLLDLYDRWDWDKKLVVVTHVVRAKRTTILISEKGEAQFDLTASGDIAPGGVDIGKLSVGFSLASTFNSSYSFIGRSNMTPLFRAVQVKGLWPHTTQVHPKMYLDLAPGVDASPGTAGTAAQREKAELVPVKVKDFPA